MLNLTSNQYMWKKHNNEIHLLDFRISKYL